MENEHRKAQIVTLSHGNDGMLLLLLQTKEDRGEYWQNITGSIDEGEDWVQGAKRELFEESGIKSDIKQTTLTFKFHDRWKRDVVENVFYCVIEKPLEITISPQEHQNYKWLAVDQVTERHFGHISNYQAFQEVLKCIS